jgi:VIT1/CCC1 family predicted Fe2+/Mn2+ transporter
MRFACFLSNLNFKNSIYLLSLFYFIKNNEMNLSKEQLKLLIRFQQQEITGYHVYQNLAKRLKDEHNKQVLLHIAEDEMNHYEVYKLLTGKELKPSRWELFKYTLLAAVLGPTFTIKLMELNESNDQVEYAKLAVLPEIPPVIADEEKHERELIGMLKEDRLNYMGSVVLGLNDALIELTGALAGFTFALHDPKLIALTGSITGIAAALSMAASEYLSTKSEDTDRHATKASVYTGIAYILTVVVLILPYLLIHNVYISLVLTLVVAILIIAGFNYYYSVVKEEKFARRFTEMVTISLGVALLSFGVGLVLAKFFGVRV